jgi:hypothetical protein
MVWDNSHYLGHSSRIALMDHRQETAPNLGYPRVDFIQHDDMVPA